MKKALHIIAAIVAIATLAVWGAGGFHTGWTQTSIPVNGVDEITGIEYTTYEDGFVAGIDVLAGGLAIAVLISATTAGVQLFHSQFRNKS